MQTEELPRVLQETIATLEEQARLHKQARNFHRKQVRETMEHLNRLRALSEQLGFNFQHKSGGTSHGKTTPRSHH